jgi:hypothetical protein
MSDLAAFALLALLPVALGYWIHIMLTYDWSKHNEDIDRMNDDMF